MSSILRSFSGASSSGGAQNDFVGKVFEIAGGKRIKIKKVLAEGLIISKKKRKINSLYRLQLIAIRIVHFQNNKRNEKKEKKKEREKREKKEF